MNSTKITIFGVGAMGALFGAKLQLLKQQKQADFKLHLFGHWAAQIEAMQCGDFRFFDPRGNCEILQIPATSDTSTLRDSDLCLILLKSHQTQKVIAPLHHCLKHDGVILSLQNGLSGFELLQQQFGSRAFRGITAQGATLHGVGAVQWAGGGKTLVEADENTPKPLIVVKNLLNKAGLPTEFVGDLTEAVWRKLIVNAVINPLTALFQVRNGELPEVPGVREIIKQLVREAVRVAKSQGMVFEAMHLEEEILEICQKTAINFSSMLQDVNNNRKTEIAAINGALINYAKKAKLDLSQHQKIVECIKKSKLKKYTANELLV